MFKRKLPATGMAAADIERILLDLARDIVYGDQERRENNVDYTTEIGKKSLQILLSRTQAGPGRAGKQEQEKASRNHVPTL